MKPLTPGMKILAYSDTLYYPGYVVFDGEIGTFLNLYNAPQSHTKEPKNFDNTLLFARDFMVSSSVFSRSKYITGGHTPWKIMRTKIHPNPLPLLHDAIVLGSAGHYHTTAITTPKTLRDPATSQDLATLPHAVFHYPTYYPVLIQALLQKKTVVFNKQTKNYELL